MLSQIRTDHCQGLKDASCVPQMPLKPSVYDRDLESDMKEAIGLLWDFKRKLEKLHPEVTNLIENMLQKTGYNRF